MDHEDFFEEVSEDEVGVEQQEEVVGVVAPIPIELPLEVQVALLAENPQSPSPSPQTPSPPASSPPQGSPAGNATSFMGFYTHDDLVDLEQ